jgi:hypothetical protein
LGFLKLGLPYDFVWLISIATSAFRLFATAMAIAAEV